MRARFGRMLRSLAGPLKVVALAVVFFRFHGSWVGATVVCAMGFLLFGVDRAIGRWIGRAAAALK